MLYIVIWLRKHDLKLKNIAISRENDQSRLHASVASHVIFLDPLTLSKIDEMVQIDYLLMLKEK